MPATRPSPDLLRAQSDERVLGSLMADSRLTRAEIASRTGLSKPTASEGIRRLEAAGLVVDTGERTTGRGRIGTYYALAPSTGIALVVDISPEGIRAEALDVRGEVVATAVRAVAAPATPAVVRRRLHTVVAEVAGVAGAAGAPVRLVVVSAADPVDRATGRLVHLPDSPFLVGELAPAQIVGSVVDAPVEVDNDVHWAARAEVVADPGLRDACYLFLGTGIGGAVLSDGRVVRGASGLAGEFAHVLTAGPGGRAMRLVEVFAALGLRHPGSAAIDSAKVIAAPARTRRAVVTAVGAAVRSIVAVGDPSEVIVGGEWGAAPWFLEALRADLAAAARPVRLRPALPDPRPWHTGARQHAVHALRDVILAAART